MNKILVILTGGTIGSRETSDNIDVNSASAYNLIRLYNDTYHSDTDFEVIQPLNILSENITPDAWSILTNTLNQISFKDYQGIIITQGSDTLAFTSALIGMLFHHFPIPIVLVASNYTLDTPLSNGLNNFRNAICLIKEKKANGVFTIYQSSNGDNEVYLSTRVLEADPYNDQFKGFGGQSYGNMINEKFSLNKTAFNPSLTKLNQAKCQTFSVPATFSNSVLGIRPYPGLDYDSFDLNKSNTKAVLHYMYHSATACTKGNNYSLLEFIRKCKNKGIDFYVASFKDSNSRLYATSREILELGVIPLLNISYEAAYIKLLLAYNQTAHTYTMIIQDDIYFETLPVKTV